MEKIGRYIYFRINKDHVPILKKYLTNRNKSLKINKCTIINIFSYDEHDNICFSVHIDDLITTDKFMTSFDIPCSYPMKNSNFIHEFLEILLEENRKDLIEYLYAHDVYPCNDFRELGDSINTSYLVYDLLCKSVQKNGILLEYLLNEFQYVIFNTSYFDNMIDDILLYAYKNGDIDSAKLILNKFSDEIDDRLDTILYKAGLNAIATGMLPMLEYLVECGLNIKHYDKKFLNRAIVFDNPHIADYLLSSGCNIKKITYFSIEKAIAKDSINALQWLFTKLEFTQDQINDLFINYDGTNVEIIQLLIDQGVNVK